MTEFCIERFISLLQTAPEKRPLLEPPKYSAYLQEHVFDSLTERGTRPARSTANTTGRF